jgi:WD40 repeat protein
MNPHFLHRAIYPRHWVPRWLGVCLLALLGPALVAAQEPKPRLTIATGGEVVRSVAISPDDRTVAAGIAYEKEVRLWDAATGKEQAPFKAAEFWVQSVAFSPDGKTLASGCGGNKIDLWELSTGKSTNLLNRTAQCAPEVVFSSDGKYLAAGSMCRCELDVWDVAAAKRIALFDSYHLWGVCAMRFAPDGKTLAAVGHVDGIQLWDFATGKDTLVLTAKDKERAEKLIQLLGNDSAAKREKAAAELEVIGPLVIPLLEEGSKAADAEIVRRATQIAGAVKAKAITAKHVHCAAFSPDVKTLATNREKSVVLWDVATTKERARLDGHAAAVRALAFSPDGKLLAAASEDGTIRLWDVAKSKELATLKGHEGAVSALAFGADSKTLASGGADKSIRLWDVPNGR